MQLKLASYYNFFASRERYDKPIITPSYIDFSGLGDSNVFWCCYESVLALFASHILHVCLLVLYYTCTCTYVTGHITSICLPVYVNSVEFTGVTCVDVRIIDLTSSFTYFREGVNAYAFIVDDTGRTLVHPRLPEPGTSYDATPLVINIETLEPEANKAGVIEKIKRYLSVDNKLQPLLTC